MVDAEVPARSLLSSASRVSLSGTLTNNNGRMSISARIDSGAEQNLLSSDIVRQLDISTQLIDPPVAVSGITGHNLTPITHNVSGFHFIISGNHHELGEFFIFDSPSQQMILGFPWLNKLNPIINWFKKRIDVWSDFCLSTCLRSAIPTLNNERK